MTGTTPPPRTGELPGNPARPSEDRITVLPDAVIVLDGVSTLHDGQPRGGWYAGELGERLADQLTKQPDGDLRDLLERALTDMVRDHRLVAGASPAATVSIVRRLGDRLDALVLGDSPVVRIAPDSTVEVVRDDRLARLVAAQPAAGEYRRLLRTGRGFGEEHRELLRALRAVQDRHVNNGSQHGYWIAEAAPQAARHAVLASWPLAECAEVTVMTDGVSCAVEEYELYSWAEMARTCRTAGPQTVVEAVSHAEAHDPDAQRWPRYKPSDDKALLWWPLAGI